MIAEESVMPWPFPGMDPYLEDPEVFPDVHDSPLRPGEKSIPLDLQAVFDRSYDAGPYHREIDYSGNVPRPRLSPKRARWVRGLVKSAG
jgi:hypothetical protein